VLKLIWVRTLVCG